MIVRDGNWVKVADPADPPPKKKKRLVTATMRAAAKRSSRMSTGPRTLGGKQRAALNAIKCAHTCNTMIFLEDESIADFEAEVALTARRLGAKTEPEIEQVRTAVYHQWQARRIERAEVCSVNQTINSIIDSFYDSIDAGVTTLTANLIAAPRDTVTGLMKSSAGCSYIIDQFLTIKEWLAVCPCFEMSMREHALRLGGHDPRDLFRDGIVMDVDRAYLGAIAGTGNVTVAAAVDTFIYDCPEDMSRQEFERRLGRLVVDLPDKAEARETLRNYVEDHIKSLTEWRSLIELREERIQADAIGAARATATPEGDRRHRYVATAMRLSNGAFKLLFQMQHERRKYGEGDLEGLEELYGAAAAAAPEPGPDAAADEKPGGADPVSEAPQEGAATAGESAGKNEAQATQVAGGVEGSAIISAAAAGISEVPAGAIEDPLEALIEAGRREFAELREFDRSGVTAVQQTCSLTIRL